MDFFKTFDAGNKSYFTPNLSSHYRHSNIRMTKQIFVNKIKFKLKLILFALLSHFFELFLKKNTEKI